MYQLPLTEATGPEIIARTVYQVILADYHANPLCYDHPGTRLLDLQLTWRLAGFELIAESLMDAAMHVMAGHTISSWRTVRSGIGLQRARALARLGRHSER